MFLVDISARLGLKSLSSGIVSAIAQGVWWRLYLPWIYNGPVGTATARGSFSEESLTATTSRWLCSLSLSFARPARIDRHLLFPRGLSTGITSRDWLYTTERAGFLGASSIATWFWRSNALSVRVDQQLLRTLEMEGLGGADLTIFFYPSTTDVLAYLHSVISAEFSRSTKGTYFEHSI